MQARYLSITKFIVLFFVILNHSAWALSLDNNKKTILIIGGTKNIGKEIAIHFARKQWDVWVTSRDGMRNYRDEIAEYKVKVLKLDISNPKEINKIVAEVLRKSGKIDVLVNNAGYGLLGAGETISPDQMEKQFAVNFFGAVNVIQEVLPSMRKHGSGHIINISSTSAVRAVPGLGMYAASKMALEGFSESLAAEVFRWNIKISLIQPATVKNQWIDNCIEGDRNTTQEYRVLADNLKRTLKKRITNGQNQAEIGQLAFAIVTSESSSFRYQTGEQSTAIAKDVYLDISGDNMRNKMITFAQELYAETPKNN